MNGEPIAQSLSGRDAADGGSIGQVLETHLTPRYLLFVLLPRDRHRPDLLSASPVDGGRLSDQNALPGGSEEVGGIVNTDTTHHALVLRPQGSAGGGEGFHQGAVDASVDHTVRLVVMRTDGDPPHYPVGAGLGDFDLTVGDEVDAGVEVFHDDVTLQGSISLVGIMQISRYEQASAYQFADLWLRELSPDAMVAGSIAEIILPIGVERPSRRSQKVDRVYVGLEGDVQFTVNGQEVMLGRGDVIHIARDEEYGFFNGGQTEARLLLFRSPAPSSPEES